MKDVQQLTKEALALLKDPNNNHDDIYHVADLVVNEMPLTHKDMVALVKFSHGGVYQELSRLLDPFFQGETPTIPAITFVEAVETWLMGLKDLVATEIEKTLIEGIDLSPVNEPLTY